MARILGKIMEVDSKTITEMTLVENYRGENYRNRSGSRDNYRDMYRDNFRDNYRDNSRWDNNSGRDRSMTRERHSL